WFGQGLEPCGDIDPVAKDVAVLDHYIALVNADAKLDLSVGRVDCLACSHTRLDFRSTAQRVDDATKFDQQAVTCGLYYPALMLSDFGVDYFTPKRLQLCKSSFLILAH